MRPNPVRRRQLPDDRGETLIELLVAVLILGVAVVAIVGGLGTAILMSDLHRKQAEATRYLDNYAASIESSIADSHYIDCAQPSVVPTPAKYPAYDAGPDFDAEITEVLYWNGSAFTTSCAPDPGVQRLTLHISGDRVDVFRDIVVRKPCRPTDLQCT